MAAVDACIKPNFFDDGEDDDGPAVFKRNKTVSTRTQLNPELKKSSSQRNDGSSVRSASDTPKSQNSGLQKGKAVSSAKVSPVKSNVASSNASTSISKSSSLQPKTEINEEKKLLNKHQSQSNGDTDDSDDDKPLSARLATTATLPKSQSPNVLKGLSSPVSRSSQSVRTKVVVKKSDEDLEDDIPLSSKFQFKQSGGPSSKNSYDSDEDKPLASKLQKNGSSKRDNEPLKSFKGLNKRPLSEASTSGQSSIKRPKPSSTPVPAKIAQVTVKAEVKTDDDDNVPIAQRMKKPAPLVNKSTSIKKSTKVATMFAVMKDTDYATKPRFIENFMNDWRQILGKNHIIKKFELCDFTPIYEWHQREKEKKKQMSTEEKKAVKEEKLKLEEKYMWAIVDGVKEKVGNFRVEPPGLFRGRGEHPKMGKLKRRICPSDITINIGKDAAVPECPIPGERWKEVKHDNTVTWLAFWNDPINPREFKYVFLAASSSLKGQSDKEKYEKARLLKDYIHGIRATYTKDFVSKDITKRQIAVATYLIDKLALRAGNEKDDDEADTVGCCTLKMENVTLIPPNKLQFDFLGKDSIRYFNTVEVELPVYKAIGQFKAGRGDGEDLFDKLDTSKLNAHLKELMPGLTAKVFRTYNASITLDEMLNRETKDGDMAEKIAVYQIANKEVAIICNHQRSVSKSHSVQMSRLSEKMDELKAVLDELQTDLMRAKKGKPPLKGADGKPKRNSAPEALERKISQTNAKIEKMERDMRTKEDLKTVALGTSKINYLDPRISVAWCKRHEVPIEKIFNKSLLAKFTWAMDVDPSFRF
ncbi:DNA topoisomerase 1 alpha-like isoform X2 [Macadamia integrifolia]|uniref:DNA topoisomerase 1 alpha-like isoform X2 n=1 Tax=Macadamia integrifolia TaxID=60698 RepID=UPI001C4FA1A7|nr:DNA topoisomerase 1 alpha-like isoform X2 [Macadamia integrifolia]